MSSRSPAACLSSDEKRPQRAPGEVPLTPSNSPAGTPAPESRSSRFAVFSNVGFRRYWIAVLCAGFAVQITTVGVGWQLYALTRDPFDLGLLGLTQFAPALLLVLVTGAVSDRYPRRTIVALCLCLEAVSVAGLFGFTVSGGTEPAVIFALMTMLGTARAFYNPARQSIVPNLVPPEQLPRAITLATTAVHVTTIGGPMLGGLIYGLSPSAAYTTATAMLIFGAISVSAIAQPLQARAATTASWETLSAGFRYIWRQKIVLGAISLDLFVVFLGGAVALLPVYAQDILDVSPLGLGLLRAGSGVGAVLTAVVLILYPIRENAGLILFAAVAGFAISTMVFAVSTLLWLSVAMLVLMGCFDMISVYVRNTLVQLWTPDELRGRVNAANMVFVGASNEVGAFRAGTTAAVVGPVAAVMIGGAGSLAVSLLWARLFPDLRRIRRLDGTG